MIESIIAILQNIWVWIVGFLNQFIPNYILPNLQLIIQIIILLFVAYIIGKIGKIITTKILGVVGLKRITAKTWAESILRVTGYKGTIVELIGDLVKWLIYILFLAVIIQIIGFPGVADWFNQIAGFMPRFIGAILIIAIGFIIADFFGNVFGEAARRFFEEDMISSLTGGLIRYSIAVIVIIMALSIIGIDTLSLIVMFALILTTIIIILAIGIKDVFPNFTAGIHLKKTLKIGEQIKIGSYTGVVEKINPLSITLKNREKRILIPNSFLIKNPIERKIK
jgi:hypothetical protein